MREFSTGANRNPDTDKYDYEGFLSPLVMEAFGAYMHFNRHLDNGTLRDSDNWQKGIPFSVYMKSLWRHVIDMWKFHRGLSIREGLVFAACGILFNVNGYLHEYLKNNPDAVTKVITQNEELRKLRQTKNA